MTLLSESKASVARRTYSEQETEAMLQGFARSESLTLYAIVTIVVALATLVLVSAFPLPTMFVAS